MLRSRDSRVLQRKNKNKFEINKEILLLLFIPYSKLKSAAVGDVCHCGNSSGWEHRVFTISSSVVLYLPTQKTNTTKN